MKHMFFLFCILAAAFVQASQSTFLYFEDKNGLRDSLEIVIGLTEEEIDSLPKWSYDATIQGMNDSIHWVWLWNEGSLQAMTFSRVYAYRPYNGYIEYGKKYLYLPADRLPVTITWNRQFYIENNLEGSVLSDMPSWFDVGCDDMSLSSVILSQAGSCELEYTYIEEETSCTYRKWSGLIVKQVGLSIGTLENLSLGLETISPNEISVSKILRDGQLFIIRDDKTYTLTGQEVR